MTEIQHDRERVILLRIRDQKVQEEALAAAGGAEHESVADVLDVQVICEWRLVWRLESRQRRWQQRRTRLALIDSEQETQVGRMLTLM